MSVPDTPQIYLVTPPVINVTSFAPRLAGVLDAAPVACVRLTLAGETDLDPNLPHTADTLRDLAHARDVPLVVTHHAELALRHGLDGVHLNDGARRVRKTRAALGVDAIVGAFCETSRHAGMTAGEVGADYIAFGPVGDTGLGDNPMAEQDLFAWWSDMIELPVVAEGALTPDLVETLAPVTDFFAIGAEIWRTEDAVAALLNLTAPLR